MSFGSTLVRVLLTCGIIYVSSVESRSLRSGVEESADQLVPVAVIYESLAPTIKHNGFDHGHQEAAKPAEGEQTKAEEPSRPAEGELPLKPMEAEVKPMAEKDSIPPAKEAEAKPMAEQDSNPPAKEAEAKPMAEQVSIPPATEAEKKPIPEQDSRPLATETEAKPVAAKDEAKNEQSDTKVEEQPKKEEPELMAAMQTMAAEERPAEEEEKPSDSKPSENSANDQDNFLRWSESHIAQVPTLKHPETRQRPPAQPILQGFQTLQQALKKPEEPAAAATNSEPQKQNRPIVSAVQQAITNTANRPNRPIAAALVNAIPKPTQSKANSEPVKQSNGGLLASIGEAFNNLIGNNANKEQANKEQANQNQQATPEQPTSNRPIDKFQTFFNNQINQLSQNFSQAIESLRPKPNENNTNRPSEQQLNQMQEDFNKQVAVLKNRVSSAFENYTMEQQNPNKNETVVNLQFIRGMEEIWGWMVTTFQGVANGESQNSGGSSSEQGDKPTDPVGNQNDEEGESSAEVSKPDGSQGGSAGGGDDPFKPMKDKFTEFYNNIQTSMSQYFGGLQTQNDPVDGSTSQGQWPNPFNEWVQQIMQYFGNNMNNNNAAAQQPEGAQNEGETTQQNNKPNFVNQIGNFFNNLQGGGGGSSGASSENPNFISQAGDGINSVINNFQKPQEQASAEQPAPAQNSPVETPEASSS